jgi:hypothetical protein
LARVARVKASGPAAVAASNSIGARTAAKTKTTNAKTAQREPENKKDSAGDVEEKFMAAPSDWSFVFDDSKTAL